MLLPRRNQTAPHPRYFLPRPLRLAFFGGSAFSCLIGTLVAASRLLGELAAPDPLLAPSAGLLPAAGGELLGAAGSGQDVVVNAIGCAVFAGLFFWDRAQQEKRVERRRVVSSGAGRGRG